MPVEYVNYIDRHLAHNLKKGIPKTVLSQVFWLTSPPRIG
jgi:hypothetical protein